MSRTLQTLALSLAAALLAACGESSPMSAAPPLAGHTETFQVQNDLGAMVYDVYFPSSYLAAHGGAAGAKSLGNGVPLIILLHGANDSTALTASQSGWNILAEELGILVAYPQEDFNNGRAGIWDWSRAVRYGREDRAAQLVALITTTLVDQYDVDPSRVMMTGFSAGAGMAVSVAVTYPELYAAVGLETGCAYGYYRCNHPPACWADGCDTEGANRIYTTSDDSATAAYEMMGAAAHRMPTIFSYGELDGPGVGLDQEAHAAFWLALQDWVDDGANGGSVPREPAQLLAGNESGADYDRYLYDDANGCTVLERWMVYGMQHAYSGSRDADGNQGLGPDMRRHQYEFLLRQTSATPGCS